MSNIVTLKSFPFDSMEILNEESGQMEDDRLYQAKTFREYFEKFLSNGVYFGHYKNLGENSMKVALDNGLTIRVSKGCGMIRGADFELETDTLFVLERPAVGERMDRVVVRIDDTLSVRDTGLYIKEGTGTTPATLQRDENIYEICIAEVTVKSTSNLTEADIVDTRLDKELCGIVNSLISVDGEELYQRFQEYIDTAAENLVRKDKDNIIAGKLTVNGGIESIEKIIANKGVEGTCTQVKTVTATGRLQLTQNLIKVNYPAGFNKGNTIVSALFFIDLEGKKFIGLHAGCIISAVLEDDGINIMRTKVDTTINTSVVDFELVLMKK